MTCEETSIAEKIIKIFPKENIAFNKKSSNRKPDIWFKDSMKLMKEIMKIMIQMMKKKKKICLKIIILKFFNVIPTILSLIFLDF